MLLSQSSTTVTTSESSSSAAAYRRTSIPSFSTYSISILGPSNYSQRRSSVASVTAHSPNPTPTRDEFMPSTPSTPSTFYTTPEAAADAERAAEAARSYIGRQIISRAPEDDTSLPAPSHRKRSLSNHNGIRPLPYRTSQRRPSNTPAASASSARRTSIPGASYSSQVSSGSVAPFLHLTPSSDSPFYASGSPSSTDDLYSGLSSYSFGAPRVPPSPHGSDSSDMISPLTRISGTDSADRTPRPSISGPSGSRSRTRSNLVNPDDGDDEAEDEEDAARGISRSKMRAIDDGTRRPSLPTNSYAPGHVQTKRLVPATSSSAPSDLSPSASSSQDSGLEESEAEQDDPAEFDTDVEIDVRDPSVEPQPSDTASINTFGHPTTEESDTSTWRASMSIRDDDDDDPSTSPVTFARGDLDDDPLVSPLSLGASRRSSVSAAWERGIPTTQPRDPLAREREDSTATVMARRTSRNAAEETSLPTIIDSPPQGMGFSDVRARSGALGSHLSGYPSSSLDSGTSTSTQAYEGLDIAYILGATSRQSISSGAPSYIDKSQLGNSGDPSSLATAWDAFFPGRRPSTITIASADPFTGHILGNDPAYRTRRQEWSFRRENADGRGPQRNSTVTPLVGESTEDTMMPGDQELWRQVYVGRFKVDRVRMPPEQPSKAPQQRLNVRHIADPYSKGNTRGGPGSVIHKHSRAIAFSIFRNHTLFGRCKDQYRPSQMTTSVSILLANRKVQEQYTSTRTTSKLNSHGLLEDVRPPNQGSSRRSTASSNHDHSRPTSPNRNEMFSGGADDTFGADGWSTHDTPNERTPSVSSRSSPPAPTIPPNPSSPRADLPISGPLPERIERTDSSHISSDSQSTSYDSDPFGNSGIITSRSPTLRSDSTRVLTRQKSLMDLDDDELSPPRTSHAEAFAAIDATAYLRQRPETRQADQESSHGFVGVLRRAFLRPSRASDKLAPSAPGAPLEGNYQPPWLTMAPRSKQEERERVIQNLNESFKDVGLLPTTKGNKRSSSKSKKRPKQPAAGIFARVPTDSLYMLLPLWPGETDKPSRDLGEDPSTYTVPVEDRQYLLVYYVPFDESNKGKQKELSKKRSRGDKLTATAGPPSPQSDKIIALRSFRICARLVGYDDLRGTGVRVPSYGLSVTGSMIEAARYLPPPEIRAMHLDEIIIGICNSRQSGMEFLPEGLHKLGLCMPTDEPARFYREEEEVPELIATLTPVGRAAVEMAWLGAMAVTSFGTY